MLKKQHRNCIFLTLTLVFQFCSWTFAYTPMVGDTTVKNYNTRLDRVTGEKTIKIIRITMDGKTTPEMPTLIECVAQENDFYHIASRGKYWISLIDTATVDVPTGGCLRSGEARKLAQEFNATRPKTFITMFRWPNNVCSYSNAGGGAIWVRNNSVRTHLHELGHLLGFTHSQRLKDIEANKEQIVPLCFLKGKMEVDCSSPESIEYGDYTSFMGGGGSPQAYAISQLHWLGWTEEYEIVKINDSLAQYGTIEVPIRPIGNNAASSSQVPLSYVYEIPGTDQRLWVGIAKANEDIFVWQSPTCQGIKHVASGMMMNSVRVGQISDPQNPGPRFCAGLIIDPIQYSKTQATLRISLAGVETVLTGDVNHDKCVDKIDLCIQANNWLVNQAHTRSIGQVIGQWDFAEGSGNVATDISGNNNGAIFYGDTQRVDGAIALDGAGDYLQTNNSSSNLKLTDSYTISLKLNAAASQIDYAGIITKCGAETGIPVNHWSLGFGGGTTAGKIVVFNGMEIWDTEIKLSDIAGDWHNVGVVFGAEQISSYLDGELINHAMFSALPLNGDGHLKIGSERKMARYYNGLIDDIFIFDYELTSTEMQKLHLEGYITEDDAPALEGRWTFDDGTAKDASGNGHNGSIINAAAVYDPIRGMVMNFQGNGYISIPSSVFASIDNEITISLWQFGSDAQPINNNIFEVQNSTGNRLLSSHMPYSGKVFWEAGNDGTGYDTINKTASTSEYKGRWNHWAFTKDTTAGEMKMYLNGQLWHSASGKTKSMTDAAAFYIGCNRSFANFYYGMIDDFRVYNYTLSEDDIKNIYNGVEPVVKEEIICIVKPQGDLNSDCKIDYSDFLVIADNWLTTI